MNARPQSLACPINNLPARLYCKKGPAAYYIEPTSGTIFQAEIPTVSQMSEYANQEYKAGVYKDYAGARDLKLATARPRLAAIKRLAPGKRLLDVGCATGFFLEAAADQGFDVRGVEFSEIAISLARPNIRERIVCGDVNSLLESEAQKYDVVTAFDIVEHVQDPGKFLREIREILTPDGLLVLSTPDTGHLLRYLMGSKWPMLQPMQHTVLFSKHGIASLLDHCGYVNVEVETAYKVLALDYLADQLVATNPSLHHVYRGLRWIMPASLRHRPFAVNIGELITFARRPR